MPSTKLNNLHKWMTYVGLEVHTVAGWSTRGADYWPTVALAHWTAGPAGAAPGTRPTLRLVTEGRRDLPGPLCQDYLGRAGEVVLVAAGRANHAGRGYWMGVTGNTGSTGTEAEAAGNHDWTDDQRKSYPLVMVAKLFAMWEKGTIAWDQIDASRVCSHAEFALPKGRKVDVNGYTMEDMRRQVADLLVGFRKRVDGKPIAVGVGPVFDRDAYRFVDDVIVEHGGPVKESKPVDKPKAKPVDKPKAKPVDKPKAKPVPKEWPYADLPVTRAHTGDSHRAWVKVLASVKFRDADLGVAMQKWLRSLGYYAGRIDGIVGPMTVRGLQAFLKRKGLYRGLIDGSRGPMTVAAEVSYLNHQRRFNV